MLPPVWDCIICMIKTIVGWPPLPPSLPFQMLLVLFCCLASFFVLHLSLLWASAASADLVQRFQHSDIRPSYHMRVAKLLFLSCNCCCCCSWFFLCCWHHSLLLATALFASLPPTSPILRPPTSAELVFACCCLCLPVFACFCSLLLAFLPPHHPLDRRPQPKVC